VSADARAAGREVGSRRAGWTAEHRFYLGYTVFLCAAVLVGFSRTFFLRAWFPEWAREHGPPESFFYVHGVLFAAWFLLLVVQASLVSIRRVDMHRGLGTLASGIAAMMVVIGVLGALIAAARPTGFMGVPVPPLQFLVVPLTSISLFAVFVTLAVLNTDSPQAHKRLMLLASLSMVEAAVARWPFEGMVMPSIIPGFSVAELSVVLFLVPIVIWDLLSRGRLHPVTLGGGLTLVLLYPVRFLLSGTDVWLSFAGWAVGLVSSGPTQSPFILPP